MLFCSFDEMLSFSLAGEEASARAALPALRKSPEWNSTPTVQYNTVGGEGGVAPAHILGRPVHQAIENFRQCKW